jgi:hypothetical protein
VLFPNKSKEELHTYTPFTFFAPGWESDQHPVFISDQILICQVDYGLYPRLHFEFDFGESYLFDVILEKVRTALTGETYRNMPKILHKFGNPPKQY